ncbi:MAG TPA: peptidoglycan DD-metalloendopeptidase family protein [Devosia sp.]
MPGLTRTRKGLIAGGLLIGLGLCAAPLLAQPSPEAPAAAPLDTLPGVSAETPAAEAGVDLRPGVDVPAAKPAPAADEQRQLEEIEASITLSNDRVTALKQEIADMQGDRAQQNAALIAAAQRVKTAEADIVAIEDRLGELIVQELEVRGRLDGSNASIANVLAALERISRNPPPALIVDPSDALGSARSAILISAILPELREKADAVMADLRHLGEIKQAALAEEEHLKANLEILEEEQLRIATLIAARKQSETIVSAELAAEQKSAEELAAKASSLKQLIADLTRQAGAVQQAAEATATANAGGEVPALDKDTIRLALANNERQQPAVPFAQAKGWLTMPSAGVKVIDFGAGDGFGGISHGLSLVTRAEATVVAPADGWVLYKGDYLNYGQIVILNAGQDYTVLLAGLASVSVEIGQFVLMGEPVGSMGSRTIGRTVSTSAGVSRPTLYIEMRKNNEPVDPTGWWASNPETPTQSG